VGPPLFKTNRAKEVNSYNITLLSFTEKVFIERDDTDDMLMSPQLSINVFKEWNGMLQAYLIDNNQTDRTFFFSIPIN